MKKLVILMVLILSLALVTSSFAKMKGEKVFETKNGKVTFSADTHKAKGLKCDDCHKNPKIFEMKKDSAKVPVPHKAGEACGVCHDGKKAFSQSDDKACGNCHKK